MQDHGSGNSRYATALHEALWHMDEARHNLHSALWVMGEDDEDLAAPRLPKVMDTLDLCHFVTDEIAPPPPRPELWLVE